MTVTYHNDKPILVIDLNEEFQFRLDYGITTTFYTTTGSELTNREKDILIAEYEFKGRRKKAEYPLMPSECYIKPSGQSENSTTTEYVDIKIPEEMIEEFNKAMRMTTEEFTKNYIKVKSRK